MKTETLGEPHQPAALLRVQTPDAPVDQIHSGLRPDSTPKAERNGVPFGAVDVPPRSPAHRADAKGRFVAPQGIRKQERGRPAR